MLQQNKLKFLDCNNNKPKLPQTATHKLRALKLQILLDKTSCSSFSCNVQAAQGVLLQQKKLTEV
jgi:hypothetical protein